jgi:hypothetical protein
MLHVYVYIKSCSHEVAKHKSGVIYNMHARSSADSFAVGSGVWSVFVCYLYVFIGLFWDPVANIIPRKNIL